MKKTICLNMIVKDEAHVIKRCLASVKPLIDYWVIVDTGSTDGTQKVIQKFLKDIPGELHERPWKNFAHNRNEALTLARGKGDYFLFIDADDRLVFSKSFVLPDLDKDYYYVHQQLKGTGNTPHFAANKVVLFIKDLPCFQWTGVVHEAISCPDSLTHSTLQGIVGEYMHDGARSQDPSSFQKDSAMLEADLRENPSNSRTVFYLAQSYRGLNDYPNAIAYYEQRAKMGGQKEEVFFSLYSIGFLQRKQKDSPDIFLSALSRAFCYSLKRAEPLFQMALHCVETANYWLGFLLAKEAEDIPFPEDGLFAEFWAYDCGFPLIYVTCSFECGQFDESWTAAQKLLLNPRLPDQARTYVQDYVCRLKKLSAST